MGRGRAHLVQHLFKVEEGPPAAGAGHVFDHGLAQPERLKDRIANGNFFLRGFGEGNADRVAQAIGQEGGNACGAFDPAVIAITGLGDAQVQGVLEALSIHAMGHQPIGRQHHRSPRGLHRNHNVVKVESIANTDEFQRRFHHPRGRIAVGKEHPLCQGTVVHPNAQGLVLLLEQGHQGFKRGLDPITNLRNFSV